MPKPKVTKFMTLYQRIKVGIYGTQLINQFWSNVVKRYSKYRKRSVESQHAMEISTYLTTDFTISREQDLSFLWVQDPPLPGGRGKLIFLSWKTVWISIIYLLCHLFCCMVKSQPLEDFNEHGRSAYSTLRLCEATVLLDSILTMDAISWHVKNKARARLCLIPGAKFPKKNPRADHSQPAMPTTAIH